MPRTHAGYRGVRWHVVEFLIDLQGPAPPGTVGYTENLAKAGSGQGWTLPMLSLVVLWFSHRCLGSSQVDKCFSVLGLT